MYVYVGVIFQLVCFWIFNKSDYNINQLYVETIQISYQQFQFANISKLSYEANLTSPNIRHD